MDATRKDGNEIDLDAKASPSVHTILGAIFGIACGLPIWGAIASAVKRGKILPTDIVGIGCLVCVFGGYMLWVRAFRLVIQGSFLSYTSLFGGTSRVNVSDIESVKTEIGIQSSFGPFYRLIIQPSRSTKAPPIIVNMKVFSRSDLRALFAILDDRIHERLHLSIFGE